MKINKAIAAVLTVLIMFSGAFAVQGVDEGGDLTTKYSIIFQDKDGEVITTEKSEYESGEEVIIPELPENCFDVDNHYTYSWDTEPAVTAQADATYRVVETAERHSFGAGVINKEPSCTEEGIITFSCECGKTLELLIAKRAHEYNVVITEPTCTEKGYTTHSCKNCDNEYVDEYVDATGHTPADAVKENEVAPTCTKDGSYDEVVYCEICKSELNRESKGIDATGHTPADAVKENEVAPTCTKDGSYDEVVYCTVCKGEVSRKTKTIEKLGHKYEYLKVDWSTLNTKTNTVNIIEVCGNDKNHIRNTNTVEVKAEASIDKDIYECGETWSSTVSLTYYYKNEKNEPIIIKPNAKNPPTGFSTKEQTLKMACTIKYDGNAYKIPNIICVNERMLFGARGQSKAPYYEYILANSKTPSVTSRVLVSNSGITLKFKNYLNNRSLNYSSALKKNFELSESYNTSTGDTVIILKPNSKFLKSGASTDYTITLKGYNGSKAYSVKVILNPCPNVTLKGQSRAVKVSWTKTKLVNGYVIKYSTSKNMKNAKTVTVKGENASSKTIKKLSKKKTYYFQVRSYHKADKTYYSEWSAVKKVKTK